MPIQYTSILEEHDAVRHAVGMFDLSHMGQLIARGDAVAGWLDALTVNEVSTMRAGQARYNIFTNEQGGAHDDVIIYRLPAYWLVVVNAANTDKIWTLLNATLPQGVSLENRTREHALIALQGPRAEEMLQPHIDLPLEKLRYYYAATAVVDEVHAEIARTGYTGEDGFELFIHASRAAALWERLSEQGAAYGLRLAGLGARDVLRLEAGMPLYGHELAEDITPLMAGLDWAVKFAKPAFCGKQALQVQRERGDYDRIVGLIMDGKAPARAGYRVWRDAERVGEIRSGSPAPALGGKNIATALLRHDVATTGTPLDVEIRGNRCPAHVVQMPFYKRPR